MYSPVIKDDQVSLTTAEVSLTIEGNCSEIRLYPYSGIPYVYINNSANVRINLVEAMTLQNSDGAIQQLILSSGSTATINVKQLKGEGGTGVRA